MTASVSLDANALCLAFVATLSADLKARQEAEALLNEISFTPGLLLLLSQIVSNNEIDISVRTSASVFLKNEVRKNWEATSTPTADGTIPKSYSEEQKAPVRTLLPSLLEASLHTSAISNSIAEAIRYVIVADFPENWPQLTNVCIERLQQRSNVDAIRSSLLCLRLIVKKYEYRVSQGRDVLTPVIETVFPLLLSLALDVCKENCFVSEVSSTMIKIICKIYWSSTQMVVATGKEVQNSLDTWMQLMEHIIGTPVPDAVLSATPDLEDRELLQQFKAKKWAMQIVHRFLARYGSSTASPDVNQRPEEKELADRFMKQWACKFLSQFVDLWKSQKSGAIWMSDRMKNLSLQYLSECLEMSATYKQLKSHIEFLSFEVCYPLMCYNQHDVDQWESDPAEFIRSQGFVFSGAPRDCAVEFIQNLARLRARDFFETLSTFAQNVLIAHKNATPEERAAKLNKGKEGALLLIGSISDRMTSKKRKLQMEPFLAQFVLPELTNQTDPFLRLRACWTYRQFLDPERKGIKCFMQPEKILQAFTSIMALCQDRELPIRVEAAIALRSFFEIENDKLKEAMATHLPALMERLFSIMAQVQDNELIVATLESLVLNFEEQIPPYAVQLVVYLSSALVKMIEVANGTENAQEASPISVASSIGLDAEDTAMTAMTVAQAISSVLSTLVEPKFHPIFEQVAPSLVPLLDVMLSPEGIDFIDDGLVLLTYLSFYCPKLSQPTDLWRYYERMYQMVCGGTSSHLVLEGVCAHGYAPDYLDKMLPSIDNLISRDTERFANGVSSIEQKSFKVMFMEMAKKCLTMVIDEESPQHALEMMMLVFESCVGKVPMIDDLMAPCFELLWKYIDGMKSHPSPSRPALSLSIRLLSTMTIYNPSLFLQLTETAGVTLEVMEIFGKVDAIRTQEGKKVFVLAFAQFLDLHAKGKLPACLSNFGTDIARAIGVQLKRYVELKQKADMEDDAASSDSDDDSEQDIEEHENAEHLRNKLLQKITAAAEDEEEDDDDYDEPEAATDDFPVRDSPVDQINELEIVSSLMQQMPAVFQTALGDVDAKVLEQFIVAEAERRRVLAIEDEKAGWK